MLSAATAEAQKGPKGTPSKPPKASEFLRTPLPIPRRSLCGHGSPALGERWAEGGTTPIGPAASPSQLVSRTPHLPTKHMASPQATRPPGFSLAGTSSPSTCSVAFTPHLTAPLLGSPPGFSVAAGTGSPLACSALYGATPLSLPSLPLHGQASTPSGCPGLPGLSPTNSNGQVLGSHKMTFCTPSSKSNSLLTTPSKIITISTPLRPCSRQKAKEMQEDINQAVEEQSVPLLRAALQRRHPCRECDHALHEAVRQAHVSAVRLLLQGQSEPSAQVNSRCTCLERGCQYPLQLAVTGPGFMRSSDRLQVVEFLLRAGARTCVRRSNTEANTPLHDAIRRGDFDVAALLFRHSADPNALNGFNETPLHLVLHQEGGFVPAAVLRNACEALLVAGASPLVPDQRGTMPVDAVSDVELRSLLRRWTSWWRCRCLAWVHSRGRHPFRQLMPEMLANISRFM
mmetsp:Transcript_12617/g.20873  ORF Transcript_12617/g.20873 Transcript_12617/m.20873 type:complete len:457 (+) Transcript_12617:35-1405(+)